MNTLFCQRCGISRMLTVNAKCKDLCGVHIDGIYSNGYVPDGLNIGEGDYVKFSVCAQCGHINGTWPLPVVMFQNVSDDEESYSDDSSEEDVVLGDTIPVVDPRTLLGAPFPTVRKDQAFGLLPMSGTLNGGRLPQVNVPALAGQSPLQPIAAFPKVTVPTFNVQTAASSPRPLTLVVNKPQTLSENPTIPAIKGLQIHLPNTVPAIKPGIHPVIPALGTRMKPNIPGLVTPNNNAPVIPTIVGIIPNTIPTVPTIPKITNATPTFDTETKLEYQSGKYPVPTLPVIQALNTTVPTVKVATPNIQTLHAGERFDIPTVPGLNTNVNPNIPAFNTRTPTIPTIPASNTNVNVANPNIAAFNTMTPTIPTIPAINTRTPTIPTIPAINTRTPTIPTISALNTGAPNIPTIPALNTGATNIPTIPGLNTGAPNIPTIPALNTRTPTIPTIPALNINVTVATPNISALSTKTPTIPTIPALNGTTPIIPPNPTLNTTALGIPTIPMVNISTPVIRTIPVTSPTIPVVQVDPPRPQVDLTVPFLLGEYAPVVTSPPPLDNLVLPIIQPLGETVCVTIPRVEPTGETLDVTIPRVEPTAETLDVTIPRVEPTAETLDVETFDEPVHVETPDELVHVESPDEPVHVEILEDIANNPDAFIFQDTLELYTEEIVHTEVERLDVD